MPSLFKITEWLIYPRENIYLFSLDAILKRNQILAHVKQLTMGYNIFNFIPCITAVIFNLTKTNITETCRKHGAVSNVSTTKHQFKCEMKLDRTCGSVWVFYAPIGRLPNSIPSCTDKGWSPQLALSLQRPFMRQLASGRDSRANHYITINHNDGACTLQKNKFHLVGYSIYWNLLSAQFHFDYSYAWFVHGSQLLIYSIITK